MDIEQTILFPKLNSSNMKWLRPVCLILSVTLLYISSNAQVNPVIISGWIKDATTQQALSGVSISNANKKVIGTSNNNGSFSIKVEKGTVLHVASISYKEQTFTAEENNNN